MVAHTVNLSPWEAEVGGSDFKASLVHMEQVPGKPRKKETEEPEIKVYTFNNRSRTMRRKRLSQSAWQYC